MNPAKAQLPTAPCRRPLSFVDWIILIGIVIVGAALRFTYLGLLEFKSDEAVAAQLALQFVKGGALPAAGLMSSVGVTNPPLFIYLLIPLFMISTNPAVVSCLIAATGLVAVVMCWHIGRRYYNPLTGAVAGALFAVAPWAVLYSRKIWAQDFVPLFAVGTMWALHALVLGKNRRAVFWVLLLPLCVIEIHFSGFALLTTVLAILLWLRPRLDWRWAVAGVVTAVMLMIPYLRLQSANNWQDFRLMTAQVGRQKWQLPPGLTIHPNSGYPLPRRPSESWIHALAIMNGGEIEDTLGLGAAAEVDRLQIYARKITGPPDYFAHHTAFIARLLALQRWLFAGSLGWLAWQAAQTIRRRNKFPWVGVETDEVGLGKWLLIVWFVVPLAVFSGAGLWTYLSYYVILYPVHFLVCGVLAQNLLAKPTVRSGAAIAVSVFLVANAWFMLDFNRFVARRGGAQGGYGTGLFYKQAAARFLAENTDAKQLIEGGRLIQMDQWGKAEAPQLDLPLLTKLAETSTSPVTLATNTTVLVIDENRTNFDPHEQPQLQALAHTNFGPMRLYFIPR